MPWVTVPHLKGKVYVPEKLEGSSAKHSCPDCFACQRCSDDRCRACLGKLKKEIIQSRGDH